VFWQVAPIIVFGEGAGLANPVTEPKKAKTQKDRRLIFSEPNGCSIF
jgi:hypothetical protein